MPAQIDSRGEFPVDITEKEYVQAALLASRRYGSLQAAPGILIAGLLCLALGLFAVSWGDTFRLTGLLLCVIGPAAAVVFFLAEPAAVRRQARKDYPVFQALMAGSRMFLYPDHAKTVTETATFTDPYALLAYCIETPELLVFIKDRERLLIVPKRCIPTEQKESVLEFLRLTFVRKRRVMRSWIL